MYTLVLSENNVKNGDDSRVVSWSKSTSLTAAIYPKRRWRAKVKPLATKSVAAETHHVAHDQRASGFSRENQQGAQQSTREMHAITPSLLKSHYYESGVFQDCAV